MKTIIGIDPGPVESAYVVWDGKVIQDCGKVSNIMMMDIVRNGAPVFVDEMVIEKIASLGMPVGESVFETVFWTGRFCEAWEFDLWHRILRKDVKIHLCNSMRAKDSNIRQALIDRFEPGLAPRCRPKGILKGISADVWQALAVAVTWYDLNVT